MAITNITRAWMVSGTSQRKWMNGRRSLEGAQRPAGIFLTVLAFQQHLTSSPPSAFQETAAWGGKQGDSYGAQARR
ncbi:hypothetical protein Q671_15545 [Halomonas sp. PBN3]|nr:hypothetical protein Q671_15545 [Halomonas sp. PBN3]